MSSEPELFPTTGEDGEVFRRRLTPEEADKLPYVQRLLLGHFGEPPKRELFDPLTQFIYCLLSSRTKTELTFAVVRNLKKRFGSWENLRDARIVEIQDAIGEITFPEQKALQIKASLEEITERVGTLTLDFLARYRTDKIRSWLAQFPGMGAQTTAAVVNFSTLRRKAISVDSHHLRVSQRLGLTPRADAATTEERLMRLVPEPWTAEMLDDHHQLVKKLGQTICTFEKPRCRQCPLLKICPYGQREVAASEPTSPI